jgi:hypothetical protein
MAEEEKLSQPAQDYIDHMTCLDVGRRLELFTEEQEDHILDELDVFWWAMQPGERDLVEQRVGPPSPDPKPYKRYSKDTTGEGVPKHILGLGDEAEELEPKDRIEVKVKGGVLPAVFCPSGTPWIGSAQFEAVVDDGHTCRLAPFELRQGMLIRKVPK